MAKLYDAEVSRIWQYLSYQVNFPLLGGSGTIHLDLGSGSNIRNPYGAELIYGTDITVKTFESIGNSRLYPADLTKPLPFEDSYFDSISAFDLIEHIPRWERGADGDIKFPFVDLMSEIFRILKPNGYFTAVTPAFPAAEAFQDPTHINFISINTVDYFVGSRPHATTVGYGFNGNFRKVHQSWLRGSGPFETLENRITPGFKNPKSIHAVFRLINRTRKLLTPRKKSHLLWVLQAVK